MAISTQAAQIALRKAGNAIAKNFGGGAQLLFKGFKMALNQDGRTGDLQCVTFGNLTADVVIADAACTVYAIFMRKQNTSTACWFKASDHATATSATAPEVEQELNAAKQEALLVYPTGWAMATGFTIGADTTSDGSTSTTSGDGPDGFVLIGA